ncbi:hypothetical protein [Methanobacterium formicicum]|nr:hypothetical protein [Methanobacterium formicicum]
MKTNYRKMKKYDKPRLKLHGDLKKITTNFGGLGDADVNYSQIRP